jgi:hypothetical protein
VVAFSCPPPVLVAPGGMVHVMFSSLFPLLARLGHACAMRRHRDMCHVCAVCFACYACRVRQAGKWEGGVRQGACRRAAAGESANDGCRVAPCTADCSAFGGRQPLSLNHRSYAAPDRAAGDGDYSLLCSPSLSPLGVGTPYVRWYRAARACSLTDLGWCVRRAAC